MNNLSLILIFGISVILQTHEVNQLVAQDKTFKDDLTFLKQHTAIIELSSADGNSRVLVAPAWQGRVMTSSCNGTSGSSFGWINYEAVKKGIAPENQREGLDRHIHVFGGEERLWLGPEGGQYSLFFPPGTEKYEFNVWKTPAVMDTDPFDVVAKNQTSVTFRKQAELANAAGSKLRFQIDRSIKILDNETVESLFKTSVDDSVSAVAFQSANRLTNIGDSTWNKDTGLPSIWILGMLKPADDVVMAVPIEADGSGPKVNTDYFGSIESDRLKVGNAVAYFKGDGKYRSKIGIPAGPGKRRLWQLQSEAGNIDSHKIQSAG